MSSLQRPSYWHQEALYTKKVTYGSPASNNLQRGDIITKIGDYDARDMRHQDANNLIKNSGNNIKIVVERNNGTNSYRNPSSCSSSIRSTSPRAISPNSNGSLRASTPSRGEPFQTMHESYIRCVPDISATAKRDDESIIEHVDYQPYRTTPLVMAGPKIKHEPDLNECWLRHYPNPIVRSPPKHPDAIANQQVADSILQNVARENLGGKQIVHKQFNSPIQLYNDENIRTTLKQQTGLSPQNNENLRRSPVKFDPSKSETLKALQEDEYMKNARNQINSMQQPVQTKVFVRQNSPAKPVQTTACNKNIVKSYIYPIADTEDAIQQSGSFKRLMYNVL